VVNQVDRERRKDHVTRAEFDELRAQCTGLAVKLDETADEVKRNTAITEEVRNILASFKVMAHIGKWVTVIAGTVTAVVACAVAIMAAIKSGVGLK
jgi:hypothetical protein